MKSIKLFNLFAMLLMASFLITSCSKDDSVTTTEEEETVENFATIEISGRSITSDAVALYCNDNGKEYIEVSNNPDLLGLVWNTEDFVVGDFIFRLVSDPVNGSYALGTAVFDESFSGFTGITITTTVNLDYEIVSNDGSTIVGSMSGDFGVIDNLGNIALVPFSVDYVADVIGTSEYCD